MALRLLAADIADGTTHTNSTTEAVLASYTIPANALQVGKVYEFVAACEVPDNNSTDTLTLYVRLGGTTLTGTAMFTSSAVDSADGDIAVIRGTLVCRAVSATAGIVAYAILGSNPDAATIAAGAHAGTVTSLDTTAALLLELTGDWSVAHADNQVNSLIFNVYEVVD